MHKPFNNVPPDADELLDALPYGVLAFAADGALLRTNAPAIELVPGLAGDAVRCCSDVFSCQAPGGPCERGCFVARVATSNAPSPEIRIDTAGGSSPGALWVTAAPLLDQRGTVVHLRPGWRGDRRRRSEQFLHVEPELRIRALGRTQVEAREDTLDADWLSQKPGQVLKYLVCERNRVVMVDEIAESIWPESGPRAIANTRYAVHRLRKKLEPRRAPHDAPAFVLAREAGYALNRERVWIDVDDFEQAVERGQTAMARLDEDSATEHLEHAMSSYRGPFLADEPYAHWAADERNRLEGLAISALRVLTALARSRSDGLSAIRHLNRLAELGPLDSATHRELVQALLGGGQLSHAKRRYQVFANRLRRELGVEPDFDLRSLSERLRVGSPG